jgi:hypothetical protein
MTAAEWYEISQMAASNSASNLAMILTLASGYLVVAYRFRADGRKSYKGTQT